MKKSTRILTPIFMITAMMATTVCASADGYKIGFAQSYNGNSYRQTQEALMEEAAEELKASGEISEYTVAEANQDVATQIQQIQDFAMQGYDLIIVDPGSVSALNDCIQEVCDMGIPVFEINDGPISLDHENLYHMYFSNEDMLYALTKYVCDQMGGSGKLIELRGAAGNATDEDFHKGVLKALEEYPDVEVVAEIYTDWTASKAQTELNSILPTLDQVDGLVTQGGDAYAAVQAFLSAGYTPDTLPVIAGDNRGSFLNWWAEEAPEGYQTLSAASNPWIGAFSLYAAVDLLDGNELSNNLIIPFGQVDAEILSDYVGLGDDEVAYTSYTRDEIKEMEVQE
jgi:ribose transport system substrate-binding protein